MSAKLTRRILYISSHPVLPRDGIYTMPRHTSDLMNLQSSPMNHSAYVVLSTTNDRSGVKNNEPHPCARLSGFGQGLVCGERLMALLRTRRRSRPHLTVVTAAAAVGEGSSRRRRLGSSSAIFGACYFLALLIRAAPALADRTRSRPPLPKVILAGLSSSWRG